MSSKRSLITSAMLVAVVLAAVYVVVRHSRPVRVDSGRQVVMGTFARAVAIAADRATARKAIEAAVAEIRKVDELMSDYKEDSEISKVNAEAFDHPVKVSDATFEVIRKSIEISELSGGAFDITVGPLVKLFRIARDEGIAPTTEQIEQAKAKVGYTRLELNETERTVHFALEGMGLDVGGIAKGYAVDRAIEAMRRAGAIGGLVDIGGDLRCFGTPPAGRDHWLVGLQNPNIVDPAAAELLMTLKVTDAAVTTSGDYQQFAIIDGKRCSHILDAKTGRSADALASVTIIAEDATTADALATAVSVLGPQKGLELIEKLPRTEAILISHAPQYQVAQTSGAGVFIKK